MTWDTVQQLLRIVMQLAAGFLVQRGFITEDMSVTLVGAVISLAGVAWWAFWNKDVVTPSTPDTTILQTPGTNKT